MPLLVGQLVYTNLAKTGFQLITSQQVPVDLQDQFVQEVVYKLWDAYNPPPFDYQAIFIRQFSAQRTLFGWLYNDGHDELGRAHIPYFLAYYLSGKLDRDRLDHICDCLACGPVYFLERERLTEELAPVILPEADQYHSPRPGLIFLPDQRNQLHRDLQKKKLLIIDFSAISPSSKVELIPTVDYAEILPQEVPFVLLKNANSPKKTQTNEQSAAFPLVSRNGNQLNSLEREKDETTAPHLFDSSSLVLNDEDKLTYNQKQPTDLTEIETIFQAAVDEFIGIRGAILLSAEGQPLTRAINLEEERSLSLAGRLLRVAKETENQCAWENFERISVSSGTGHLVLSQCLADVFLLVQAENMLTGLLEVEIKRMIKKIQAVYQGNGAIAAKDSLTLWQDENDDDDDFNDMMMMPEEEVLYRGRRLSL